MMQNSGLGNAVSPLTSLNQIFHLPVLLIITWRGDPRHSDEPQHALMGGITTDMLDLMDIPWEYFPDQEAALPATLDRALLQLDGKNRPYALVMRKGCVAPHSMTSEPVIPVQHSASDLLIAADCGPQLTRTEALSAIIELSAEKNHVIIAATGYTGRELYAVEDRNNHLYMVGSMGCASSLGLGLSLTRPDLKVVVVDGDGSLLMRMGSLATIGSYGRSNLIHILLDNRLHESTGGQATVSGNICFASIAHACNYELTHKDSSAEAIPNFFRATATASGPGFLHLPILSGTADNLPRPKISPVQVKQRLMEHIGTLKRSQIMNRISPVSETSPDDTERSLATFRQISQ